VIDRSLLAWFVLTAVSVLYVAWDAFRSNPEMTVMKWGFILVTLFMGPVGAFIYILSCKPPVPQAHAEFVTPLWKQAVGSTVHCLAGDATGIILAAALTTAMGLRMWHDLVAEYVLGFAFGLLIFQALFMRDMFGGSYSQAVRKSLYPEWVSMNAVMAGMVPVMVILMSRDMSSMHPSSLRFWGVMSLATIAGFIAAYPVNLWLVGVGAKHGMGTVLALGKGGDTLPPMAGAELATATQPVQDPGMHSLHGAAPQPGPNAGMGSLHGSSHGTTGGDSPISRVTLPQQLAMAGLTLIALWGATLLAGVGGKLGMGAGTPMSGM